MQPVAVVLDSLGNATVNQRLCVLRRERGIVGTISPMAIAPEPVGSSWVANEIGISAQLLPPAKQRVELGIGELGVAWSRGHEKLAPSLVSRKAPGLFVDVLIAVASSYRIAQGPRAPDERLDVLRKLAPLRRAERTRLVRLVQDCGGQVTAQHLLGNSVSARVPGAALPALARLPEVVFVSPGRLDSVPPAELKCKPEWGPFATVKDGRDAINSDGLFLFGYGQDGLFAIIDTGVNKQHVLLYDNEGSDENRIRLYRDCDLGTQDGEAFELCASAGTDVDQFGKDASGWTPCGWGHGTKTACILSGRQLATWGDKFRGVTAAKIDSWRYKDILADVVMALEGALANGATVVVGELQVDPDDHPPWGGLALAFDEAFDLGVPVIVASGNYGRTSDGCGYMQNDWPRFGSVACPGNAHRVIAVGFFDPLHPQDGGCAEVGYENSDRQRQSLGPTADGRFKPDVLAPTRTITGAAHALAEGVPDDQGTGVYGHSSGATPYAAGACLLLQNFFIKNGLGGEPGKIYAAMIAFGESPCMSDKWPFNMIGNINGAGRIVLGNATNSVWMAGGHAIYDEELFIEFNVSSNARNLRSAIWWPESTYGAVSIECEKTCELWQCAPIVTMAGHKSIGMSITDANGTSRGKSEAANSVFQKVAITGNLASDGLWILSILPNATEGARMVYWFVYYDK